MAESLESRNAAGSLPVFAVIALFCCSFQMSKKELVVYALSKPSRCHGCDKKLLVDELAKRESEKDYREVFCMQCAGLADFALIKAGNAQLTRKATKLSSTRFLVMKWSELWKVYERVGVLVEKQALERASK